MNYEFLPSPDLLGLVAGFQFSVRLKNDLYS